MKIYRVGGSVRDELLGIKSHDNDYVVVGSTPEEMLKLGFQPVGRDFPVFLHPKTKEEYALARTERKIARGYTGFKFNTDRKVSLEDDLSRRDITINAMAFDESNCQLIDPFGGFNDLHKKIIRHISTSFIEDPLRVLRVARFSAKLKFSVAPETLKLMQEIAKSGELETLSKERVWQEFHKAILTAHPEIFFKILHEVDALKIICPEIDQLINTQNSKLFDYIHLAVTNKFNDVEIFALINFLLNYHTKHYVKISSLSPPNKFCQLAKLIVDTYLQISQLNCLTFDQVAMLIKIIDPQRRTERLKSLVKITIFLATNFSHDESIINNVKKLLFIIEKINQINYGQFKNDKTQIESHIYTEKIGIIAEVLSDNKVKS